MRVLLTGASGFIGSRIARALIARGDEVTAVIRPGDEPRRLEELRDRLFIVEANLESADLNALVAQALPDVCINMAWFVEPGRYLTAVRENLRSLAAGTRLLEALDQAGCPRAVLAGTCLEPGTIIDGETRPPETIYAAAKHALHEVGVHLDTTSVACAHVFHVYGPGEDPRRLVAAVIRATLSGALIEVSSGERRRDFMHVEDVASAISTVAASGVEGTIDICTGRSVQLGQIFDAIGRETGRPDLIQRGARDAASGEPSEILGDAASLNDIGWRPRWNLQDGIEDTISWWRARLELQRNAG